MKILWMSLFVMLLFVVGCASVDRTSVVLASSSNNLDIPLSKVVFRQIDIKDTPPNICLALGHAMKDAGFPLGLTIGGYHSSNTIHLKMWNVTLREVVDQICVQSRISYWDHARLRELYFVSGESSSFFPDKPDGDGRYTFAGPSKFAPAGYFSRSFRPLYFDRTIEDLAKERGLLPKQ